jgi:1-deoxy-D-xylulose-5-phosphate reductoisomerase
VNSNRKKLALLGSTGSIGQNTLEIVAAYPDRFRVVLLSCRRDVNQLMQQAEIFRPQWVSVSNNNLTSDQKKTLNNWGIQVAESTEGLRGLLTELDYDLAVNAIIGAAGLLPTLDSLECGIDVAIANKETLVMAGRLVMDTARKYDAALIPIDSEHSAIYQCLRGETPDSVSRILLTASGGPFRGNPDLNLSEVSVEEVLKHPTWDMGAKITVDCATMMNKGLEVIEAHFLFDVPQDDIDVVIHPQSVIHSMVEFVDGSIKAQLGSPDMKLPILYALTGGERVAADIIKTDLCKLGKLEFEEPDHDRFPCLNLAYQVLNKGGTAPAVLSGADEEAVELFLTGKINFTGIHQLVSGVVEEHELVPNPDIDDILTADRWARTRTKELGEKLQIPQ